MPTGDLSVASRPAIDEKETEASDIQSLEYLEISPYFPRDVKSNSLRRASSISVFPSGEITSAEVCGGDSATGRNTPGPSDHVDSISLRSFNSRMTLGLGAKCTSLWISPDLYDS